MKMALESRIPAVGFALLLATIAGICGCGEKAPSPPPVPTAVKLTPEQELAALIKKADSGDAEAQFNLGVMYVKGEEVAKDDVKAASLFQKSATQGNAKGQCALAISYEYGRGVTTDLSKAVEWYQKSASQNNPDALFGLGLMHASGAGLPKDRMKAEELWQKAAESGSELAISILGERYATLAKDEFGGYFLPDKAAPNVFDQFDKQPNNRLA